MADTLQLGPRDNGRSVNMAKGQLVVLQLPENATTGYRWAIAASGLLELTSDTYAIGGTGIGAGGIRRFEWRANAPGTHDLLLLHRREWESAEQEIGRFHVTVTVQ